MFLPENIKFITNRIALCEEKNSRSKFCLKQITNNYLTLLVINNIVCNKFR